MFFVIDCMVIKLFYFFFQGFKVIFGSEVKVVFVEGLMLCGIDVFGFFGGEEFDLRLRCILFVGVYQLGVGMSLIVDVDGQWFCCYWCYELLMQFGEIVFEVDFEVYVECYCEMLIKMVESQFVVDVFVVVVFFGGFDFFVVVVIVYCFGCEDVMIYIVFFDGDEVWDFIFVCQVVEVFGVCNCEIVCLVVDIIVFLFVQVVWFVEGDFDFGFVVWYYLFKVVYVDGVKVFFLGQGVDELFIGYDVFYEVFYGCLFMCLFCFDIVFVWVYFVFGEKVFELVCKDFLLCEGDMLGLSCFIEMFVYEL